MGMLRGALFEDRLIVCGLCIPSTWGIVVSIYVNSTCEGLAKLKHFVKDLLDLLFKKHIHTQTEAYKMQKHIETSKVIHP